MPHVLCQVLGISRLRYVPIGKKCGVYSLACHALRQGHPLFTLGEVIFREIRFLLARLTD